MRYSLTPSNRKNGGGLSRRKFTVFVIRSIAVQLSDNISDIWSSVILFRAEIVIIQVCDEDISSLAIAKQDHALAKTCWQNFHDMSPLKKTVNGHFLFRLQYNCPVFPSNIQDRRRSGQRFDILILFYGDDLFSLSKLSHGRLPKYLIDGRTFWTNRSDPYAGVLTDSKKKKSPASVQAVFQVAPASISSWFLCPHPPLLLSAPNQNRHDTQAGFHLACSAGVFFGRANFFALENAMLLCLLSLIFLRHKIKDGGYNNTNINKQLSLAQNTPALQARFHSVRFTYYLSR